MTTNMDPPNHNTRANNPARKIVIDLAIMTAIGVVLAIIGPFGSFAEPFAYRLVSWVTFSWVGYAIYSPMNWLVDRLQSALDLPRAALWVVGVAVATVPMTTIVWSMGFLPGPVRLPTLEQALTSYFYVFLVGGGVTAFFYIIEINREARVASTPRANADLNDGQQVGIASRSPSQGASYVGSPVEADETATLQPQHPRLIERLPANLGSDVIALEMEDHYVRVHTALGSEMVLMRLRDAMAELDGIEGRQVHRSWWVARGAVEDVARDGRNVRLILARGIEAPVSRAQVSELKEAGWI